MRTFAQVYHGADPERFERLARRLAGFVLHGRWGDVVKVAEALAAGGRLSPWELAGLIGERRLARRVVRTG